MRMQFIRMCVFMKHLCTLNKYIEYPTYFTFIFTFYDLFTNRYNVFICNIQFESKITEIHFTKGLPLDQSWR